MQRDLPADSPGEFAVSVPLPGQLPDQRPAASSADASAATDLLPELERRAVLSRYLQATVEAARDGVLAVSPDRRVLAVNKRFCELWQLPEESIAVGDPSPALLDPSLTQVVDVAAFQEGIAWGHAHPSETQTLDVPLKDGRVIEGYAAPILDADGSYLGRVWYLHDDTERRAAERQREELMLQLAAAQRSQRFLLDASTVLAHAQGFVPTLQALAAVAVPTLGDLCLIDVLDERGQLSRVAAVHADPERAPLVDELQRRYPPEQSGDHPSVEAMRTAVPSWLPEMTDDFLRATTRDERHFEIVKTLGFTSYMSVPLVADEQVLGTVTLVSCGSGRRFGLEDVSLAQDLAERVALVVAKERRFDTERLISRTLQASLLAIHPPQLPGHALAVRYLPSTRDTQVGGDFWDVTQLACGQLALAVGDVAGHDVVAAATMAQLRSACRALLERSAGPADLIRQVHDTWHSLGLDRMVTAVFACYDPANGRIEIASAGHLPPLIVDGERVRIVPLDPASPFGAPPSAATAWSGVLPPGASLMLYTDGLVEDRRRDIDEGTERLAGAALSGPAHCAEALADHILATLSADERSDDVALLLLQRLAV